MEVRRLLSMLSNFKYFILIAGCWLQLPSWSMVNALGAKTQSPNIILILADDLGYADLSAYGGKVNTPNIDQLAKEGIRFTDFHSNGANCSPTRASLLTGRYQQRIGIVGALGENSLGLGAPEAKNEITIAHYLNQKGYKSGFIGKWHLGYNKEQSPLNFGFDEFRGMLHGAVDYHSHVNTFGRLDWWHNDKLVREEGYVTHLVTNHAMEFIEANKNGPFFLLLSHLAIHFPWQSPEDEPHRVLGKRYREVSGPLNRLGAHSPEKVGKVVERMLEELDKSVGAIMEKLLEMNLDENTLVLFISDNGGITEYNGGYTEISSNHPLRGAKHTVYEGGHRVPAIAHWQGRIESGTVSHETVMTMDILPTLLKLVQIDAPDKNGRNSLDGINLLPLLLNGKRLDSRHLFWQVGGSSAVRSGNWKLVVMDPGKSMELYNLHEDIGEDKNLAIKHPTIVKDLFNQLQDWEKEVNQKYYQNGKYYKK
ncbi:sulfatase-like hydrolase/transferase [Cyclobacterium xiamenense]|uniref:sulfatase-like hydrolase/transferase n=1 Tax=Cyclobacterium xiamenense TaxID=1297121 RepID=UPI0035CEA8B0